MLRRNKNNKRGDGSNRRKDRKRIRGRTRQTEK
jgi:hypothetical protein